MSNERSVDQAVDARRVSAPVRRAVIGIGNALRGDDGVGLAVVRALRGRVAEDVMLIEHDGDGASLLFVLEALDRVIVIDAVNADEMAGAVRRFDAAAMPLPVATWTSTHAIGLAETIELARAMHRLPQTLVVYGIAGSRFSIGDGLAEDVGRSVLTVADEIVRELSC